MKKLLITLATVLLLAAVVMAVKPTGERQGHAPNTGIFGQCGEDAQCDDNNPCTTDTCDMSTKPGQCVNAPVVAAVDDVASTTANTPVDIDLILNDQVKTELGYGLVFHQPSCGSVVAKSGVLGGICTFTPAPDYCGTCTFVYSLYGPDNACSSDAEVTVDVSCPGCPDGQKECDGSCIDDGACCTPNDCPIMIGPCVDSMTCDDGVCRPQFKMNGVQCTVNVYEGQCCEGECLTDPDVYCAI